MREDILENRLKMFTGERINFYIPDVLLQNKDSSRSLDYYFKFISNLKMRQSIVTLNDQKFYIPIEYIKFAEEKKKSLLNKFQSIHAIVC